MLKPSSSPRWLIWLDRLFPLLVILLGIYFTSKLREGYKRDFVIWSDAEGYYAHLPATFIYGSWDHGFEGDKLPAVNCCLVKEGKTVTRYTNGIAMLQAPFFFVAHGIAKSMGSPGTPPERYNEETDNALRKQLNRRQWSPQLGYATGFSDPYIYGVLAAALFYLALGLYFLKEFLKTRFTLAVSLITTAAVWLGTNLFYYAHAEAGMSHLYSFFLFALFLFLLPKWLEKPVWWRSAILGAVIGFTVLIRPTNIILLSLFAGYEVYQFRALGNRLKVIFSRPLHLGLMLVMAVMVFVPQLLYFKSAFGSYFAWSYADEGFDNWANPQTLKVWFSHQNGLFLYTPLALVMVAGMAWQWFKKAGSAPVMLFLFVLSGYIFGSWWAWWFGGAFGHRCYVEFYALFALPLAGVVQYFADSKVRWMKLGGALALLFLCYAAMKFATFYDPPWDGPDWTWARYFEQWKKVIMLQ